MSKKIIGDQVSLIDRESVKNLDTGTIPDGVVIAYYSKNIMGDRIRPYLIKLADGKFDWLARNEFEIEISGAKIEGMHEADLGQKRFCFDLNDEGEITGIIAYDHTYHAIEVTDEDRDLLNAWVARNTL